MRKPATISFFMAAGVIMSCGLFGVSPAAAQTMYASSGMQEGQAGNARLQAQQAQMQNTLDAITTCGNGGKLYGPAFSGNKDANGCETDMVVLSGGGISITHGATIANGLTVSSNGMVISAGGATITGDTALNNNLTVSGNTVLNGTLKIKGVTTDNAGQTIRDADGGWVRMYGATGWYNSTYGGGMYMADSTWVQTYGSKSLKVNGNLSVTGTSTISGNIIDGSGDVIRDSAGGWVRTYGNTGWYNGTYTGGWYMIDSTWVRSYNNKSVYTSGTIEGGQFYHASDERLKKDISTVKGLQLIEKLRGVQFTWRKNGHKDMGLIAQEVEKVAPQLVTTGPEGYKAVSYESLIGPLVEAVKTQQKEIEQLKAQVADLKNRK